MRARIAGVDDTIGVQVWDNEGREHRVLLTHDGEVEVHEQNAFPVDADDRTPDQQEVIDQVQLRAKYTAQFETDADVLSPSWNPVVLENAIEAIRTLDVPSFTDHFREYFEAVQHPTVDVPLDQIHLVMKGLRIEEDSLLGSSPVAYLVERDSGELEWLNDHDTVNANVSVNVPPLEIDFPFGERFREYLVHHLQCQIRDVYDRMGEVPPEEYRVDGYGKLVVERE